MPTSPAFLVAESLDHAIGALQAYGDDATVVAGSTAVTIMLQQGLIEPAAIVSIGRIPGLQGIERDGDQLVFGALTTHREVELSPIVRETLPVLAHTFGVVANVRVRNAATVGGVVAEADYASDPPALLRALDAEVDITGPDGDRTVPIADFLLGFYETALEPAEIVTRVRVPLLPDGTGAVYEKFTTRSSEDRPCIGVAAIARLEADGSTCADLRVAVGAAAEVPQRFPDTEVTARGRVIDEALAASVAEEYANQIDPLSDMRGSDWYRREMIHVWVRRAILGAAAAAGTTVAS
jgi:aerobic carbon-monoxide dehydrogenase medium subunit